MKKEAIIGILIGCGIIASLTVTAVPRQDRTVADGVYTMAQAERGYKIIQDYGCRNCHGAEFEGGPEEQPPLIGEQFVTSWSGKKLDELAQKITTMPADRDAAYQVKPAAAPDVIAFLLYSNGYPGGQTELPADKEVLKRITIVAP